MEVNVMLPANYDTLSLFDRLQKQFNQFSNLLPVVSGDDESNIMTSHWSPAVDIKEEDKKFVITADIPGVDPKDIDVTTENGILTIKGERKAESKKEGEGYMRVERSHGVFYRRFSLPESADCEKISASSRNGVLELSIPKRLAVDSRKIQVKS
jgi:HSP20 family protein